VSTPELTDAEFWVLETLEDASSLPELLMPFFHLEERQSRLPWRRWQRREIRGALELRDAAEALTSLLIRGLVEIREVDERLIRPHERRPVHAKPDASPEEWVKAILVGAEPHPFATGRPLTADEVDDAIRDPENWKPPAETRRDVTYWVDMTEAGERAYADSRIHRESGPGEA
jgi:hypothetical protein